MPMWYRNKLTGAEFHTNSIINAENYEAITSNEVVASCVEEKKTEKKAPTKKKVTKK